MNPAWEIPATDIVSPEPLEHILKQPFHYLGKGHQSYVFCSADQNYVIKFYRFPSHLRPLSWLDRPLAYRFSEKRKKIKNYNLEKLALTFRSFKLALEELKEESGLIYVHLNKSMNIKKAIHITDLLRQNYQIQLDEVPFVIQKKAQLIFPTLEKLIREDEIPSAKKIVFNIINLVQKRLEKGIFDEDPVIDRNYGLLADSAILIDVGRLTKKNDMRDRPFDLHNQLILDTEPLKNWLKHHHKGLFDYYQILISNTDD